MKSNFPIVLLTRVTKNDLLGNELEKWKYECTACPFRTHHITNYALHRKDHVGKLEFPCGKCDKTFSERSDLKSHYDKNHIVKDRLIKCEECDKDFFGEYNLGCGQRKTLQLK